MTNSEKSYLWEQLMDYMDAFLLEQISAEEWIDFVKYYTDRITQLDDEFLEKD